MEGTINVEDNSLLALHVALLYIYINNSRRKRLITNVFQLSSNILHLK